MLFFAQRPICDKKRPWPNQCFTPSYNSAIAGATAKYETLTSNQTILKQLVNVCDCIWSNNEVVYFYKRKCWELARQSTTRPTNHQETTNKYKTSSSSASCSLETPQLDHSPTSLPGTNRGRTLMDCLPNR